MEVDKELDNLIKNGTSISIDKLISLKKFILLNKHNHIDDILNNLMEELEVITYDYLKSNTINGISTTIYLPSNNEYYLNISGGKSIKGIDITYNTEFDIASVSKLFTLILIFKYIDEGIIQLNMKICEIDNDFKYLDLKVEDIIKMAGTIITDNRIDEAFNKNDALNRLYSVHPVNYDMNTNHYTDIGFMVLSNIIEKINNKPYNEVMISFLKQYGICINNFLDIAGNGHMDNLPHDPKARIMNGMIGSAGIFINSDNMSKLAKEIFINDDFISRNNLRKLSLKLFDKNHPNKGYAGIYIKHPLGIKKTSTPNEYSNYAFSHQGFTGSCAIFDPLNQIHNSILIDAIKINETKKHPDFFKYFNDYHQKIIMLTLKSYLIKKFDNGENKKIIKKL